MNRSNFYFLLFATCILLIISCNESLAQDTVENDSISEYKTKFIFSFDARRSFMFGETTKLSGLKLGFQVQKKHRFGLCFYDLQNNVLLEDIDMNHYNASIDFGYTALFYEYEFFNNDKFEFGFPIHLGGGSADVQIVDTLGEIGINRDGNLIKLKKSPFFAGEISFDAEYKIRKWFGVGAGIGYRKVWTKETKMQQATSGAVYSIKVKIYLGVIYKGLKKAIKKKPAK